jgi:hypothetical protein
MRPIYITLNPATATSVTDPIVLDQYIAPANVAVTVNMTSGTSAGIVLEFTTDNVLDPAVTSYVWQPFTATPFSSSGAYSFTSAPSAVEAMFAYAPKALRVRWTAAAGSPVMNVQVIQYGIGGT